MGGACGAGACGAGGTGGAGRAGSLVSATVAYIFFVVPQNRSAGLFWGTTKKLNGNSISLCLFVILQILNYGMIELLYPSDMFCFVYALV